MPGTSVPVDRNPGMNAVLLLLYLQAVDLAQIQALLDRGRHAEVRRLVEQASPAERKLPAIRFALAVGYREAGDLKSADRLLGELLDAAIDGPTRAQCLLERALVAAARRHKSEAFTLSGQALELTVDPPERLHVLVGSAHIHLAFGDYRRAEPLAIEAAQIARTTILAGNPENGTLHSALGAIAEKHRAFAAAESHYRQALEIAEPLVGRDHREVGMLVERLASVSQKQGKRQEANALRARATEISRRNQATIPVWSLRPED